jgi:hypothetical protein
MAAAASAPGYLYSSLEKEALYRSDLPANNIPSPR